MKLTKFNVARLASGFVTALAVALLPFASANAATNIWDGTTNLAFGTASNWSTGAVPLDNDSIVFDSTNTTTAYPASASLTNATGNAFAALTAQGTTGGYNFTINLLKTAANATLSSTDTTNNKVTVTALTANGNVTLDGVVAGTINLPSGGIVTLKNITTFPTSITGATGIVLDNDGTVLASTIATFNHTNVTLTGAASATALTLTTDATLAANYPLTISGNSILTLSPNITITDPITMTGGQIKTSGTGTTTVASLTIPSGTPQYVLPAGATLFASAFTLTSPATFTQGFGNAGTFANGGSGSGGTGGTGGTGGSGATGGTGATTTPAAPNTAFKLVLTNPLTIAIATVAVAGAVIGVVKLRKQAK